MIRIEAYATGIPKGQPRPRAFSRGGRAACYDPGTAEGWKAQIALALRPFVPDEPIAGPVFVKLTHTMPRPRGHYRTGKRSQELRDRVPSWHTGKPDCDNLAKAALDAMTQLGIWRDDSQVAEVMVSKRYGPVPGCEIVIRELVQ